MGLLRRIVYSLLTILALVVTIAIGALVTVIGLASHVFFLGLAVVIGLYFLVTEMFGKKQDPSGDSSD